MKPSLLVPPALLATFLLAPQGGAVAVGGAVPPGCVAHTTFSDGADLAGDHRCAGLAVDFHTAGSAASPFPLWAGQWLFVDEAGQYRRGTCTFNRGTHPTTLVPSREVAQSFPNDPTGAKGAYLAWRYGDTNDPMVAAGLWAVFHHYALDAAGSNRSANPSAPLVPRLDGLAAASGRADLQAQAVALDAEARRMSGEWTLGVEMDTAASSSASSSSSAGTGTGTITVTLLAGDQPVTDHEVTVLVSGDDVSRTVTTGTNGRTTVTVPFPSGTVTVAATTVAPGEVQVYRGLPAAPNPLGAQTLVAAGPPRVLRATSTAEVVAPTTTIAPTTAPTTTIAPTTVPPTTAAPTTTAPVPTAAPTTASPSTAAPTTIASTTTPIAPTPTAPASNPPLPTTGRGGDGAVAQYATAFLVGGIGLLGTLRRRTHRRADAP